MKRFFAKIISRMNCWLLDRCKKMYEEEKIETLMWRLLKDRVPGFAGYKIRCHYNDELFKWKQPCTIYLKMVIEPEYGNQLVPLEFKNSTNQKVIATDATGKACIEACLKAAQYDDVVIQVPLSLRPMLNGQKEIIILKRGTTYEQLMIELDLKDGLDQN